MRLGMKAFPVFLAVMLTVAGTAAAKVKTKKLPFDNRNAKGTTPIAIDPDGTLHATYCGERSAELVHARLDGKKWIYETIETLNSSNPCTDMGYTMGIGEDGNIHIVYEGLGGGQWYAFYNGTAWDISYIGGGAEYPQLVLDGQGNPHILLDYSYVIATLGELGWDFESAPGGAFTVDPEGFAHIASDTRYATNKSGTWESTTLTTSDDWGPSAIALGSDGLPRVVTSDANAAVLTFHRFNGANWSQETIVDFEAIDPDIDARIFLRFSMVLDSQDYARIMMCLELETDKGTGRGSILLFENGDGWNALLVDPKYAGWRPTIAINEQDEMYVTYGSYKGRKWARIGLPDITGNWTDIEINGSSVTGTLEVINNGLEKSDKATVRCGCLMMIYWMKQIHNFPRF